MPSIQIDTPVMFEPSRSLASAAAISGGVATGGAASCGSGAHVAWTALAAAACGAARTAASDGRVGSLAHSNAA